MYETSRLYQREIVLNLGCIIFALLRALFRMEGEDVFGSKISVRRSNNQLHHSRDPLTHTSNGLLASQNQTKSMLGAVCKRHFTPFPPPPNPARVAPPRLLNLRPLCGVEDKKFSSEFDELSTYMVFFFHTS